MRIDLQSPARKNTPMPRRTQDSISKPVVVIRRRPVAISTVTPSAVKPAVAKPKPVATAMQSPQPVSSPPVAPKNTPTPKPPTPPEDPAVIAARRGERIAMIQAVLKELMDRWPQTFSLHPLPVRPLATGIGKVIAAQLPEVAKTLVHQAIAFWQRQRQTAYLQALIAGGPRYDLEGNPQGAVTPEQQQRAQDKLVAWRAYRQEKQRTASQRSRSATAREGRDIGTPPDVPPATE